MAKRTNVASELLASLEEAVEIVAGRREASRTWLVPPAVDVRAIRRKQQVTQEAFAARYGFTVGAVRDWEQGRYQPDQASRAYLLVIDREPEAVERALMAA